MANDLTCKECVFCWKDDEDNFPCCHFERRTSWDVAPCEQEEA